MHGTSPRIAGKMGCLGSTGVGPLGSHRGHPLKALQSGVNPTTTHLMFCECSVLCPHPHPRVWVGTAEQFARIRFIL